MVVDLAMTKDLEATMCRQGRQCGVRGTERGGIVAFLGGVKFKLADHWVVSGAVNVPINNQGFRPTAVGTGALEYYF
jgi:hypothetical protein